MNLHRKLLMRAEAGNPVTIGLIGGGKFGAMFLAQARLTSGLQVAAIMDLAPQRARDNLSATGWSDEQFAVATLEEALKTGGTFVTDDTEAVLRADGVEVIVDATGDPTAGIRHALLAIEHGKHVVMVNVEADVLAGPLLARRAEEAGVVYSLAYGDQPALICEQVDWARAIGFKVVTAGKGTKYHPDFHQLTQETIWSQWYQSEEVALRGGLNPKMATSFLDGSKSAIEMTAVCNATGLTPQPGGLKFPPAQAGELAEICKPEAAGGQASHAGTTEVVSSIYRDGSPVENNIVMGVYVVVEADNDYVAHCFEEYSMLPDSSYRFSAMYRPTHLIGLELGISIASAALRGEATGSATGFRSDVVATAKKDLAPGEILDGEGGDCVWGKQMPASVSVSQGALPLGLTHDVKLVKPIKQGETLRWTDVEIDETRDAVRFRRQMEQAFAE